MNAHFPSPDADEKRVLERLRTERLRHRFVIAEIDAVGHMLAHRMIGADVAIDMLFSDDLNPFDPVWFAAEVERLAAENARAAKRRRA